MPCPYHPKATITWRNVPVEVYPAGTVPPYRIVGAQMARCDQCGAQWYNELEWAKLPHTVLPSGQPPS